MAVRPALRSLIAAARSPQDGEILRLAVPAFGALVAEPLFLLADSAIVGRIGTVPLGGLGVASQALTTLVGISIFLAYGTTAAVARQLGAGNTRAAIRQGIDGLWLAALIGVVVLAVGWPLAPAIVGAFGGSAAVTAQAAIYLRISLLGAPAMLAVLAGTGVLRGLQDTKTPCSWRWPRTSSTSSSTPPSCSACTGASPGRPGAPPSPRPPRPPSTWSSSAAAPAGPG